MVGRAASSNPWIFRQIEQYMATGRYDEPSHLDRYEMMRTYYAMLLERKEDDATGKMKQFATYFTHGVRGGARLRTAIYQAKEATAIAGLVDDFFAGPDSGEPDHAAEPMAPPVFESCDSLIAV
jgi:tRNA-dihydrouridine synthase